MTGSEIIAALLVYALMGLLFRLLSKWSWLEYVWFIAAAFALRLAMIHLRVPFLGGR